MLFFQALEGLPEHLNMPDPECERLIQVIKKKDLKIKDFKEKIKGYKNKIKELSDQKVREKEANKRIEDLKGKKDQLEKEIIQLKKEIEELKKELKKKDARMDSLENTIEENKKRQQKEMEELKKTTEENKKSHRKEMQELKDGYKADMREFEDRNAKTIQKLKESHEEKLGELEHYSTAYQINEGENQDLREENRKLNDNSKDCQKLMQDQHKLYLGQLCFELETNLYRYVMPERCCAKGWFYKIKDIENDIDLLNDKEKQEAQGRLGDLKKRIDWDELKKLTRGIAQIEYQRSQVAHPPDVDEEGALHAAEELDKKGQLKGQTSIKRVKKIIEIWATSKSLLDD